jgi:hypothetical protein
VCRGPPSELTITNNTRAPPTHPPRKLASWPTPASIRGCISKDLRQLFSGAKRAQRMHPEKQILFQFSWSLLNQCTCSGSPLGTVAECLRCVLYLQSHSNTRQPGDVSASLKQPTHQHRYVHPRVNTRHNTTTPNDDRDCSSDSVLQRQRRPPTSVLVPAVAATPTSLTPDTTSLGDRHNVAHLTKSSTPSPSHSAPNSHETVLTSSTAATLHGQKHPGRSLRWCFHHGRFINTHAIRRRRPRLNAPQQPCALSPTLPSTAVEELHSTA